MPIGKLKNTVYKTLLPLFGLHGHCQKVYSTSAEFPSFHESDLPKQKEAASSANPTVQNTLSKLLQKHHVIGSSIQLFRKGELTESYVAGLSQLDPSPKKVNCTTIFRTASIAKFVLTLLTLRLQQLGKLNINQDINDFFDYSVRNPNHPTHPITLRMLLSHTSSIIDSQAYYFSLNNNVPLSSLLQNTTTFTSSKPGSSFHYSNLGAGVVACILESHLCTSLEVLAQQHLFLPLKINASFDLSTLKNLPVANSYRILPPSRSPSFDADAQKKSSISLSQPNPQFHYVSVSGGLYITAHDMARLLLPLFHDGFHREELFWGKDLIQLMQTPCGEWPQKAISIQHGVGLLQFQDTRVSPQKIYGHQGFAYGAVNGVFFTSHGDGFVSLNSGASEQRLGHLSLLNKDLITLFLS